MNPYGKVFRVGFAGRFEVYADTEEEATERLGAYLDSKLDSKDEDIGISIIELRVSAVGKRTEFEEGELEYK